MNSSAPSAAGKTGKPQALPADPRPRGCTSLKVRQLSRRVSQHFDRVIGNVGLKTTQFSLLSVVVQFGPLRPGELASRLQMDASTLTRNLQPLIAQGWIRLGPGDDGRSRLVAVTEAGRGKQLQATRCWKQAQTAFNRLIGDAKVAELHALVDECLAALGESAEEVTADDVVADEVTVAEVTADEVMAKS